MFHQYNSDLLTIDRPVNKSNSIVMSSIMDLRGSTTFEFVGVLAYGDDGAPLHYIPLHYGGSTVFAAGGYYWCAWVYPTNTVRTRTASDNHFSVSLKLCSSDVRVTAAHEVSVLDPSANLPPMLLSTWPPLCFASDTGDDTDHRSRGGMDLDQFVAYVHHGRILFQSTVTVVSPEDPAKIDLPPSDMLGQLGDILETAENADVTFSVDSELFPAHKIILAARSRVFKAELYGEMKENGAAQAIVVDDMRPDTFRALLRYIYTDDAPPDIIGSNDSRQEVEEGGEDGEDENKVWELLVAADRYGVERLKLICERVLCKRLDVDKVAETLALADRHHCDTLKDACIEFMTTSHRMGQVAVTPGYMQLKSSNPCLLFEVLEKSGKFH
ncbi:hypothetical protein HU200_061170 [Digitaria exilis]|uniref:BTB domain-containing protein n=1 Tax=Digitaria exilis TaxID=1010633 RepID=A0A835A597_9POAL|nr:hypothetical protein HU200_061170 [Digitaria exilis]